MEKIRPLSECMRERNKRYYQSPVTSIYDDFLTYAQSEQGRLAKADAACFHAKARQKPSAKYQVLEAGVGEGAFAYGFLQALKELDQKHGTELGSQVHYVLADFSPTLLQKARSRLEKGGFGPQIETREWDATDADAAPMLQADLIRCNELFSDLPADAYVRKGELALEVDYDDRLKPQARPADWAKLDDLERKLLLALPPEYVLPFNHMALQAAGALAQNLKKEGRMNIFDYGFYQARDFDLPPEVWNSTLVREYHGQWTVDLNFLYMSVGLKQEGYETCVQPQEEFVKQWIGEGEAGRKKDGGAQKRAGLDYDSPGPRGMQEDDFFYHLEVKRP